MSGVRFVSSLSDLRGLVSGPKLTVVDFFAVWCGPCKTIAPYLDQLAVKKPHVNFCKVDVDKCSEIMREYPVRCMPTFMFFKDGTIVEKFEGADVNAIESIIRNNEVLPPPPIPQDEELEKMKPKDLLALMKSLHISSSGLVEKSELVAELRNARRP